jgi:glutamine synthetase
VPGSLEQVIDRLETDHEFLLAGGVFTPDVIESWIAFKSEHKIDPMRLRPHPCEFALYFDLGLARGAYGDFSWRPAARRFRV